MADIILSNARSKHRFFIPPSGEVLAFIICAAVIAYAGLQLSH